MTRRSRAVAEGRRNGKPAAAHGGRVYSKGSTIDAMNRFAEIEVWGRPAK